MGDRRRESGTTLTELLGCELSRWIASGVRWCNAHLVPVEANPTVALGVAASQGSENVVVMGRLAEAPDEFWLDFNVLVGVW